VKNGFGYCRQGFEERLCCAELSGSLLSSKGVFYGYAKVVQGCGFTLCITLNQEDAVRTLIQQLDFNRLYFARPIIGGKMM